MLHYLDVQGLKQTLFIYMLLEHAHYTTVCMLYGVCMQTYSRLTKDFASKVSETDIPLALVVVQATQTAVAIEGQDAK